MNAVISSTCHGAQGYWKKVFGFAEYNIHSLGLVCETREVIISITEIPVLILMARSVQLNFPCMYFLFKVL